MTIDTASEVLSYGYDLLGGLRKDLKTLQGFRTVVQELLQNAEDARDLEGRAATRFWLDFRDDALWVGNDGQFTDENFAAISSIGAGSKRYDEDTIGSFGVGFVSVYQITDQPEVYSRNERRTLSPLDGKTYRTTNVSHPWPSTFRLPWADTPSDVRTALEALPVAREALPNFIQEARVAFMECGVFLRRLNTLTLLRDGQPTFTVQIERPDSRTIRLAGSDGSITTFRRLDVTLTHDLKVEAWRRKRKPDLTLAYPLHATPDFQGRLYAYLPTREATHLPLHVNADFYPNTDRKSLLWDEADKRAWNDRLLQHAASAMPAVLEDLKAHGGAEATYEFTAGVERGAQQLRGTSSPLATFADRAWSACYQAYRDLALFEGRNGAWVSHASFLTVKHPHDATLTDVIARHVGWVLPPERHARYAKVFSKLQADELNAAVFFEALKILFSARPTWLAAESQPALEILSVFLAYLDTLRKHERAEVDAAVAVVDALHLALNVNQDPRPIRDVRTCPPEFLDTVRPWLMDSSRAADTWLQALPSWLRERVPDFRPDDLCEALSKETPASITTRVQSGWHVGGAYRFLERTSTLGGRVLRTLPIYRTQRGAFAHGTNIVLPMGVDDPFGVREVLDVKSLRSFPVLLERLNFDPLDAPTYYGKLLPEFFDAHAALRRPIVEHLAKHYQAVNLTAWKGRACVECRDGQWRQPDACYFPNDLMDQLFGGDYPAYDQDRYSASGARGLMMELGVRTTAGESDIVAQMKLRVQERLTDAAIALRAKILEYTLEHSSTTLAQFLSVVAWLPNEQRTAWRQPGQLYTLDRKDLIGTPVGVEYCALPLPKKRRGENLKALRFMVPTLAQFAAHVKKLNDAGHGPSNGALNWLDAQAERLQDADVAVLQSLRLFSYCDSSNDTRYDVPHAFFLKDPGLGRWRHTLNIKGGAFKQLVKRLGVREVPDMATYRDVLLKIASKYSESQIPEAEDFKVAERCFHELARAYGALKADEQEHLMAALRGQRLVPVTGPGAGLGALAYPHNALHRDMPRSWHEQFDFPLTHAVYLREGHANRAFLGALGVAALSESHVVQYRPRTGTIEHSMPSLDGRLNRYALVLLRLLFKEFGQATFEEKRALLQSLRFVQTGTINATVIAKGPGFSISSSCVLEAAFDASTRRLLVADARPELGSEALAEAFTLPTGAAQTTLFIIWSSASPEEANQRLNVGKFPDLPEEFKPQHVPGAVSTNQAAPAADRADPSLTRSSTSDKATSTPANASASGNKTPSEGTNRAAPPSSSAATTPSAGQFSLGPIGEQSNSASNAAKGTSSQPAFSQPSGPSPFAGPPPSTRRDGHQPSSGSPKTPAGSSSPGTRLPQRQFKNYVYVYQGSREDVATEAHAQKVDRRGMQYAMEYERQHARTPEDCSGDTGAGYDIFSQAEDGTVRHIELKTTSGPWGERGVTLSRNQLAAARKYGERYWLYVIENLDGDPVLHAIQHPEGQATYYVFNDGWRGNASEEHEFLL
ncbi:DUF3883 domain-containing protein [Deinococcus yavapaiensis]|uniref:Uncharacterized protein DUF3883 n=1 Tax=Deinococcus yavapaiensis KR-236 TaxID=694435 RepID=A0A318S4Q2_9DEIO|nr:DUF3883 domain-containing protein [Deinococcus yavapaiensis]PYE51960.1 uncharacterized protein DUF3883 [Deinococcus yavapaiensis KR-236]